MKPASWVYLLLGVLAILVLAGNYVFDWDKELKAYELESLARRDAVLRAKFCARRPILCNEETKE